MNLPTNDEAVIPLVEAIIDGGFFDDSLRPRRAVAKVGAKTVNVYPADGDLVYDWSGQRHGGNGDSLRLPGVVKELRRQKGRHKHMRSGRTMVPTIPMVYQPLVVPPVVETEPQLLLFEVEGWVMAPPRDPALIQRVDGDHWKVLAMWEEN